MRASFLEYLLIDILTMADTVELAHRAMRCQHRLRYVALDVANFVLDKSPSIAFAGILVRAIVRQSLGMAPRANSGLPPGTSRVGG